MSFFEFFGVSQKSLIDNYFHTACSLLSHVFFIAYSVLTAIVIRTTETVQSLYLIKDYTSVIIKGFLSDFGAHVHK